MLLSLIFSCASENYARLYHREAKAPSLLWEDIQDMKHMGPTLVDRGINFSVYSANATRIEVLLFDDPESNLPTQQFELLPTEDEDIWNLYIEGIGVGQHYGYIAWGPNWEYDEEWVPGSTKGFRSDVDGSGNRFNPNKLLFDPWGKAIHRDHDWFKGSVASGPKRAEVTYAAGSKTVVVESVYEWSDDEVEYRQQRSDGTLEGHGWQDLIFYEVHPKGLSQNPASQVEYPGTYRGIGEMAPYLQDLGITALELLPIHEKPLDGGYWGYNNLNFFAPENTFAATYQQTGRPLEVIDEFKWMVDQLHQHGVEVIIDVVYNHTGEGGLWRERLFFETYEEMESYNYDPKEVAGLYSFRGLDNASWYALSPDGQTYWNNTGVGNQTRPNNRPMRQLIMDSLHFYVEELHVDGFRFDLAGILGEPDLNYNQWVDPAETVLQDIIDDPILLENQTRIIAEPWTASGTGPGIGGFPTSSEDTHIAWYEWNAKYRDWWREFVNFDDYVLNSDQGIGYDGYSVIDGGAVMTGSSGLYGWNGRKPYHSVNFVTVHDGFTMYDLFSYNEKQNGCGLLNPVCCEAPLSVWCDTNSGEDHNRSRDWGSDNEPLKRQLMRNLFTGMMISYGSPLILGGDEWMRTKYGNNNSYYIQADNEWNWFRWGEWRSESNLYRSRMHDFVRDIIQFRKDHAHAFAPAEHGGGMSFAWKTPSNYDMSDSDWSSKAVMMHYYNDGDTGYKELAVLINMERTDVSFSLPTGRNWGVVVDTQYFFDDAYLSGMNVSEASQSYNIRLDEPMLLSETTYTVKASSIVILEDQ